MPRSKLASLNASDAPELAPGARTAALQRAHFQDRCKKLHDDTRDSLESDDTAFRNAELKLEQAVSELKLAFPAVDKTVIREQYLLHACNSERAAEVLLLLSSTATGPTPARTLGGRDLPVADDASAFPSLGETNQEWEILDEGEIVLDAADFAPEERSWAERAREGAGWANSLAHATSPPSRPNARLVSMASSIHMGSANFDKKPSPSRDQDFAFELRKSRGRRGRPGRIIENIPEDAE